MLVPPVSETLVSNLSVCLFQDSHLFLQFHPLGLWGCLQWSSYFKTHLVFSRATLSPPFCLKLVLSSVHPVCTSVSLFLSTERPGTPEARLWEHKYMPALAAELLCQPLHSDLAMSFYTDQVPGSELFH